MSRKRHRRTPVVESEGRYFISIDYSGIHPMVPYIDGMAIASFEGDKRTFLLLEDAIAWHVEELAETNGVSGSETALRGLRKIAQLADEGKTVPA